MLCDNDLGQPQALDKPKLKDDIGKMNPEYQKEAMMKFKQEQANLYYPAARAVEVDVTCGRSGYHTSICDST